jgi:hypothetical protein
VAMVAEWAAYYRQHQGWEAVAVVVEDPPWLASRPARFILTDGAGQVIIAGAGYRLGIHLSPVELPAASP